MMFELLPFLGGLFVLAASCYALFKFSDELEDVGDELGHLLRMPEDVIASTLGALATSGPEIVMAILAATPFILSEAWLGLQLGEKASSGTLNMAFSAMDNLLGIGALAIIFMILKGMVNPDQRIKAEASVIIGLLFYFLSSMLLAIYITDGLMTEPEAWSLMIVGIIFVGVQFFMPQLRKMIQVKKNSEVITIEPPSGSDKGEPPPMVSKVFVKEILKHGFMYAFLVFAMVIFVRESLAATFNMAQATFFSVGGIIIMFTSYVSSFPEFMMTYRYAVADKQAALLGMLFGSNVIDLAFAGFRAMWLHEPIEIYTTGFLPGILPFYIWALPIISLLSLVGIWSGKVKYKFAYPALAFYVFYILSGFILL